MGNGFIPDEAITSSSETQHNPAHLGRLGGKRYWCSAGAESESHLEISLSKTQRITSAIVDLVRGQQNIGVALLAENGDTWHNLFVKKVMNLLHTFLILAVPLWKMCSDCKTTLLRITQRVLWGWEIELNGPSFFQSMFVSSIALLMQSRFPLTCEKQLVNN